LAAELGPRATVVAAVVAGDRAGGPDLIGTDVLDGLGAGGGLPVAQALREERPQHDVGAIDVVAGEQAVVIDEGLADLLGAEDFGQGQAFLLEERFGHGAKAIAGDIGIACYDRHDKALLGFVGGYQAKEGHGIHRPRTAKSIIESWPSGRNTYRRVRICGFRPFGRLLCRPKPGKPHGSAIRDCPQFSRLLPLALSVPSAMSSVPQRPRNRTAAQDLGPARPRE